MFFRMSSADDHFMAYRLIAPKWATTALSGEGARLYGGRWNSPGRPMVYLATSRALAALELLVHLTTPGSRRIPRTLVSVRVPKDIVGGELWQNEGWRDDPPGKGSTDQGDDWLSVGKTGGVFVPSAIIAAEQNLLLNPLHADFGKVDVIKTEAFSFDHRLACKESSLS